MGSREVIEKYLKIERVNKLYNKVKEEFERRGPISHNWDHIYRDIINAVWIGEAEGADMDIVVPAIILHDVGFLYDPNPSVHHTLGSEKCYEWLDGSWTDEEKKKISGCIRTHKGKILEFNIEPVTLEEKVVCDADLVEKAGCLGILQGVRTFVEFAESSNPEYKRLINIARKFATVKELKFYTKTGKKIADRRGGNFRREIFVKAIEELEEYE